MPRRSFFERLGGAVAPQLALDGADGVEDLLGREVGGDLEGLVGETLGSLETPRLALVTVRTTQDGADAGIDQLLGAAKRLPDVAEVAAGEENDACHATDAL